MTARRLPRKQFLWRGAFNRRRAGVCWTMLCGGALAQRCRSYYVLDLLLLLRQRTEYDMEMLKEMGVTSGIENYSRILDGRPPGSPRGPADPLHA